MKLNRRQIIASTATAGVAIAVGATWYLTREDSTPRGASDRIDLVAGAYTGDPHLTDPEFFAMLSLTGGLPSSMSMELRCFDLEGLAMAAPGDITASLTNLVTGEIASGVTASPQDDFWTLTWSSLASNGWWQLVVQVGEATGSWTFLVPDPNLTGFGTPPAVDAEPDATAMLAAVLDTLSKRTSLRWWEWLSGGNGSIILARFAVTTTASNGQPDSFESDSFLAGRIPLDGTAPSFRDERVRSVTVSSQAERVTGDGTPEVIDPIGYLPIDQYFTTYAGYDGAHFGIQAEIDGRACQLIAFHLPAITEAWFAFWVEIDTLQLRELFMLSVNHYMHWVYYDIDNPFIIEMPSGN